MYALTHLHLQLEEETLARCLEDANHNVNARYFVCNLKKRIKELKEKLNGYDKAQCKTQKQAIRNA